MPIMPKHRAQAARRCFEVGLGYVKLGQPATTLSGGEAQRVKLASELCQPLYRARPSTSSTSRPSACIPYDVHKLIGVLQRLVDAGNTVVVIEHNLDVIKVADHIIDLGPEGGDMGRYDCGAGNAGGGRRYPRFLYRPVPEENPRPGRRVKIQRFIYRRTEPITAFYLCVLSTLRFGVWLRDN